MDGFFTIYLTAWSLACVVAGIAGYRLYQADRHAFRRACAAYRRFLCVPWKLVMFGVAAGGIVLIAPYTGDPTWDYYDAWMMAVLTFVSAPWAVGILYLALRRRLKWPLPRIWIASCLWMFSASWCYDLYLLWRDGHYPMTWLVNIVASSVLYLAAGLFWNLDWRPGRGVTFSFLEADWPACHAASFARVVLHALPFMLIVAAAILYFVVPFPF